MSNHESQSSGQLPAYIASAKANPAANRAPWYKNTAPTYAGIFLWFVFWQQAVATKDGSLGGSLSQGIGWALLSLILAAVICHALFYLVPGLLGMQTGLPLYIVGTSTFGAQGGFLMPGFLMGILQFGWLGVNVYFASVGIGVFLYPDAGIDPMNISTVPGTVKVIMVAWGVLAAFVGLKGIQYVAKVATYLPLIPLAILLILLAKTAGGLGSFDAGKFVELNKTVTPDAPAALSSFGVLAFMLTFVVGFFATAGAAGVDFGTNSRDKNDVQMGGLIGIALAIVVTAGISILVVAGAYGNETIQEAAVKAGDGSLPLSSAGGPFMGAVVGATGARWMAFLLALAAFPPACFSSFIAANSFKTTLPNVNPFISVGIGAAVSIILAITGWAGDAISVFEIIGASFGPICGAMLVDYLLSGGKWAGPRAGFNPAGWVSWALGFIVGITPVLHGKWEAIPAVPAAPVAAFIVGTVVYFVCAKLGMTSKVIPLPSAAPAEATAE